MGVIKPTPGQCTCNLAYGPGSLSRVVQHFLRRVEKCQQFWWAWGTRYTSSVWQYFLCVRVRCVEHFSQALRPDFLRRFLKASTFASFVFLKRALLLLFSSFRFLWVHKASAFASFCFFCVSGSLSCKHAQRWLRFNKTGSLGEAEARLCLEGRQWARHL